MSNVYRQVVETNDGSPATDLRTAQGTPMFLDDLISEIGALHKQLKIVNLQLAILTDTHIEAEDVDDA